MKTQYLFGRIFLLSVFLSLVVFGVAGCDFLSWDNPWFGRHNDENTTSDTTTQTEDQTETITEDQTETVTEDETQNETENATEDESENATEDESENATEDESENGTESSTENTTENTTENESEDLDPTRTQEPYPDVDESTCGSWVLNDNVCCPEYCSDDDRSENCSACGGSGSALCEVVS
ncbi:MAG: hypothetical protein PVI90_16880, partial [Desulfobacteraceae bacterium]